ncbi:MAG: N-acetyl-gamma-glutamyl-phosphate reductase [Oscillospiraceae bacterium]|nr:N-acetyl-gamma-glutamyl-phosphate reductase [Oscillospiraceae bacterium]
MINAGIIGATGYAGAELVRILLTHPQVTIAAIGSVSFEGKALSDVYGSFLGICDLVCENNEEVINKSDVIFACVPHGLSQEIAVKCVSLGKKFIDLGADFRLDSEEDYKEWYGLDFTCPELHKRAVYGLPELFFNQIENTDIIGNPGCYPTSIGLGLFPAIENGLVKTDSIIIDSKSGATGAGRGLAQNTHFADCNEAFAPYKVASHRHTPEIEQTLSRAAGKQVTVTFVPHLLPINRGIISTMYVKLRDGVSKEQVRNAYEAKYNKSHFVRVLKDGDIANLRNVKYTNLCDISLHFDDRTGTLIVVSAIDNMVKGAAGQAVQNMNIIFGLEEQTGLEFVPPAF